MNRSDDIQSVRSKRASIYQAASLLARLDDGKHKMQQQFDWQSLLDIPQWCFWPKEERVALTTTAGALFLAPIIKQWIDAARIRTAREILGETLFDAVMQYQTQPQVVNQPSDSVPVDVLLMSSGSTVLLSSLHAQLQPLLMPLLPPQRGQVQHSVAKKLAVDAESLLLTMTAAYMSEQQQQIDNHEANNEVADDSAESDIELDDQSHWNEAFEAAQTNQIAEEQHNVYAD